MMPIRCKLISPTNLMLERPLYLAPADESEFTVHGMKEFRKLIRERFAQGWQLGFACGVLLGSAMVGLARFWIDLHR